MLIGIDARLYSESGIGRYIKNLLLELEKIDNENHYIVFVTEEVSRIYHPQKSKEIMMRFKSHILLVK